MRLSRKKQRIVIVLVISFVFLLASYLVDNRVVDFVESIKTPFFNFLFGWISLVLSLLFVLLIMTSLFMWEENKKDWIIPLWFSAVSSFVITYIIKFLVARDRPLDPMMIFGLPDYSFPSAHAAVSFAAVAILDEEYPTLKWFWLLFAVMIGISRIYLQVHYLSDVLAGAILGYSIGLTVIYLKKKHSVFG